MFLDHEGNKAGGDQFTDAQTHHGSVGASRSDTPYLGPASVVSLAEAPGVVNVRLATGEYASAAMAVVGLYRPTVGDQVLAISQDSEQVYIIGVLQASNPSAWSVPGDLVIAAPKGSIRLECAEAMRLKSQFQIDMASPRMSLRATRLEFVARRLVQRIENAYLWVKELFQVRSRRCRTVAEESFLVKTQRARMKSEGNFNINGETIHLG